MQEGRHLCWCCIPLDCSHSAQIENKRRDMVKGFFTHASFFFPLQNTTEDPMVLKANMSVSVCDTGLHFAEGTHWAFSVPIRPPETSLTEPVNLWPFSNNLCPKSHGQPAERQCTSCFSSTDRGSHVVWHLSTPENDGTEVYHKPI